MSKHKNISRKHNRKKDTALSVTAACLVIAVCMVFGGLICIGLSGGGQAAAIGVVIFLSSSVVLSIPAAMSGLEDTKENKYGQSVNKLILHGHLTRIMDTKPYRMKIIWGVFRKQILKMVVLISVFVAAFGYNLYMTDHAGSTRVSDRAWFTIVILAIITLPCITYGFTHYAAKFMRAVRGKYVLCRGVLFTADGFARSMSIEAGNEKIHKFDHCRGIGTFAKSLEGKTAIIAFFNDEIYVMRTKGCLE